MTSDQRLRAASRAAKTLAIACVLTPASANAQQTERGAFILRLQGDTFAIERFTRGPAALEGEIQVRSAARVAWEAQLAPDGAATRFDVRVFPGVALPGARPVQTVTMEFRGDSAHVRMATTGGAPAGGPTVAAPRGTVPFTSPSVLLMEEILVRARRMGGGGASVPILPTGAAAVEQAAVRWIGADSAVVTISGLELRARVNAAGRLLGGAVPAQNLTIERTAKLPRAAAAGPDYSAPAGAPYTAVDVTIPTPGGFSLAGTLTVPKGASGRVPAVITISGSGQQDRDETLPGVAGYRPFRQIADTLGRRGIAVLRLDDRGYGASGGDVSRATSADFAADVRAALAWLRARPEIDPARVGLVGHSEGGIIAPMVAAEDARLKTIVLIAATARPGRRVIEYQLRYGAERDTTLAPAQRDSALRAAIAGLDSLGANTPWFGWFMAYDPLPTARRVKQPVLILQGATDMQVTADQAEELAGAIRQAGNRDVMVRMFAGVNHLLLPDPVGNPAGYGRLPSKSVDPRILGAIADWLDEKLK